MTNWKLSISNLALPTLPVPTLAAELSRFGIEGIELAPTLVWPEIHRVSEKQAENYLRSWREFGMSISGLQSLLYGRPDLQLFDRESWPMLRDHMVRLIHLARTLEADVAVLGSPKNRVRGPIGIAEAELMCAEFLADVIPVLAECGVVLTLEPNAPQYGADFLTNYAEVVSLSDLLDTPWVQPQIDSGSLAMVGDDLAAAVRLSLPSHVHASCPNLLPPPCGVDHDCLRDGLAKGGYSGWIVLEMLKPEEEPLEAAMIAAEWLSVQYRNCVP